MKKTIGAFLLLTSLSNVFASEVNLNLHDKIDLRENPEVYSRLYQNLSEEDRAQLFEAQNRFYDAGGLVPDMTAACSKWVTFSTVVRAGTATNIVEEVYFDVNAQL